MAKKKITARGRDIQRLTSQYQQQIGDVASQITKTLETPSGLEGFQQQSADYQKRLQNFRKTLEAYEKNPFVNVSYKKMNSPTGGTAKNPAENWLYNDLYLVPEITTREAYTPYTLREMGYEVEGSGQSLTAIKKQAPIPTFTEKAPALPDTSKRTESLQALEQKKLSLGEEFQRELSERKSARLAATSRRERSRPMLSKGASLNG